MKDSLVGIEAGVVECGYAGSVNSEVFQKADCR